MKKPVNAQTLSLLHCYHRYHGGREIRHCGIVKLVNGGEMHLMRFVDSSGNKFSSLDMIFHGPKGDYTSEMMFCPRHKEKEMIVEAQEVFR